MVVLPEYFLSPEDHIKLAEVFGEIDVNRFFKPVASHPIIAEVRTSSGQTKVIGGTWHADHSYDSTQAMCSILSEQRLPPFGDDTHFASMSSAYYAMSLGLQNMLSNLSAWHSIGSFVDSANVVINPKQDAFRDPGLRPVAIKHPKTGAPCVCINGDFTVNFENWTAQENIPLLFIFMNLLLTQFSERE